ncbi:MAG: hypothetical protein FWD53_06975, partial [Phycisphaerales bacterium]|nr:hypothetical protein [Phycisphaerales bacterium]
VYGAVLDAPAWLKNRDILERGTITAFQDHGSHLYTAGDYTKSYSPKKAKQVTRQIVYIRPGTFIIFDRIESTNPAFKKKFILHPMTIPEKQGNHWIVTNGNGKEGGRLFIQTLAPSAHAVELFHGEKLYTYSNGKKFTPNHDFNLAPECRMEITATNPETFTYFLHVLTATDATVDSVPLAIAKREGNEMIVEVEGKTLRFALDHPEFML